MVDIVLMQLGCIKVMYMNHIYIYIYIYLCVCIEIVVSCAHDTIQFEYQRVTL